MSGEWSVSGPLGVSGQAVSSDTGIWANGLWAGRGQGGTLVEATGNAFACRAQGGGTPDVLWPAAHEAEAVRQ